MRSNAFLWLGCLLLILFACIRIGSATPVIVSWQNSKTVDNQTAFSVNVSEVLTFNVTANQSKVTWSWTLNGFEQNHNFDNWSYSFEKYGTYYVNISGSNSNGTTQTVSWKITAILTLVDDMGCEVKISKKPERIVSLAPANTEILFAIGAGDRVKGVTDFCDYPPEMVSLRSNGSIEIVGSYTKVNREKISSLSPDLIFAAYGNDLDDIAFLRKNNFPVIALNSRNIEDVLKAIELAGRACDAYGNASALTSSMRARINAITASAAGIPGHMKLRVFYVIWYPEMWTAGSSTFGDDVISKAGGINIASKLEGWKMMNKEPLVQENPEVIIISSMGAGELVYGGIVNDSAIQQTDAYKTSRIYIIDDPNIIERPGPRIVDGLEKMHSLVKIEMLSSANKSVSLSAGRTVRISSTGTIDLVLDVRVSANMTAELDLTRSFTPVETNRTLTPALGKYFTLNASSNLRESLKFVTMKIYYTGSELSSSNLIESSLAIWQYNSTSSEWEKLENRGVNTNDISSYSGYTWANVSHFSTYGVGGDLTPAPEPATDQSSGSVSSGTGGGGGVATGEPYENLVDKEVQYIWSIKPHEYVSKGFTRASHPILEISFTCGQATGEVSIVVESLLNKSQFASQPAPGELFSNINIWVSVPDAHVSNASVKFWVDKNWIASNSIDPKSIALYRYSNNTWSKLATQMILEEANRSIYIAQPSGFSPFAISGGKIPPSPAPNITSTPAQAAAATPVITPTFAPAELPPASTPTPGISGFMALDAIAGLSVIYLLLCIANKNERP